MPLRVHAADIGAHRLAMPLVMVALPKLGQRIELDRCVTPWEMNRVQIRQDDDLIV